MSIKLTDTQLMMLSTAAQREDRCLELPKNLKGNAAQKVAAKLLTAGLVKEIKAKAGAVWRRDDETGQSYCLKLTAAGLKAIAVDDSTAPTESDEPNRPPFAMTRVPRRWPSQYRPPQPRRARERRSHR
jgi:hypothetical protein